MSKEPRPHISSALAQLRLSVRLAAVALGVSLVLHMLIWAFVHETDLRWTMVKASSPQRSSLVVTTDQAKSASASAGLTAADAAAARQGAEVNRVHSKLDVQFRAISDLAQVVGVVAALTLALLMMQSVSVAGGASAPGVERIVAATAWMIVLAILCLPLKDMASSFPIRGVFSSYDWLTTTSEALRAGGPSAPGAFVFVLNGLLLPLVAFATLAVVIVKYNSGVELGVIATSLSELDEKLDREMARIAHAAQRTPRAVGALNRALGDEGIGLTPPSLGREPAPRAAEAAEPERRIGEMTSGEPLHRPI